MKPIKFEPLLKQTLWGGEKIIPFKHLAQKLTKVGESWEISGVKGNETIVKNGEYKGKNLNEVVSVLRDSLVGVENYKRFGNTFPLLIKFIDACQQLSIQVHPNDELARKRGFERGKTEMWYVMKSEPYAALRSGLKKEITPNEYERMVANDTITDAIAEYKVKDGDCFFLPSGRIHSIGAGCFLAEIQQTSDVTYRIYDFKRKDKNGNYRQLHTKEAAECIDYHIENNYRTDYVPQKNKGVILVRCPYFSTTVYDLDEPIELDYSDLDSFVILVCIDGDGILTDNEGNVTSLNAGESLLIPATTKWLKANGSVRFLETYI
jgi:mannose-6-phosphate isomerase